MLRILGDDIPIRQREDAGLGFSDRRNAKAIQDYFDIRRGARLRSRACSATRNHPLFKMGASRAPRERFSRLQRLLRRSAAGIL